MVGQENQHAEVYKGAKDIVAIANYVGLEGVAEEWYRDLILQAPKRSWMFEKAASSLFLAYALGLAASQAAREFDGVKYDPIEGAREYAWRLETKTRHLAREPDKSTMIVRFLAGRPVDLGQRLALRGRLDPARHQFNHFVDKLHELEEAEGVMKADNAAIMEQQRMETQGLQRQGMPRFDERPSYGRDMIYHRCWGKGHYASDLACPMFGMEDKLDHQLRDRSRLKAVQVLGRVGETNTPGDTFKEAGDMGSWDNGSQWEVARGREGFFRSHEEVQWWGCVQTVQEVVVTREDDPSRAAMHSKIDHLRHSGARESCLARYVGVDGMEEFTPFDSRSSVDTIGPDLAWVDNTQIHGLERPMSVKLGTTVGSYAVTDYRTQTPVRLRGMKVEYHLGVFHANCYDTTLGASSTTQQSVVRPDFNSNAMIMGDNNWGSSPRRGASMYETRDIRD